MADDFIAYFGEEHGLAYQAALSLQDARPAAKLTPRHGVGQTLATLIAQDAQTAVVPLINSRDGYDADTLTALIHFNGGVITEEISASDHYCLAIPDTQLQELVQSGFPGSAGARGAAGRLLSQRDQLAYSKRVDTVFATTEAERRCSVALNALRGDGVQVRTTAANGDPYRDVLRQARAALDPERQVKTIYDGAQLKTESTLHGAAHVKQLYAAVLPYDVARQSDDYVIVRDHLDDSQTDHTRFLVIDRKEKSAEDDRKAHKSDPPHLAALKKVEDAFDRVESAQNHDTRWKGVRVLVKLDTRGEKTADISDVIAALARHRIDYRPIYLHHDADALPVVFDIELTRAAYSPGEVRALFKTIFNKSKGRDPKLLGAFPASELRAAGALAGTGALSGVAANSLSFVLLGVGALLFFIAGVALERAGMLAHIPLPG